MNPGVALDFKQFEVLTFDCYGTLIDWESGILSAVSKALSAHGISGDNKQILERYAQLEAEVEAGPYVPYREVLAQVMKSLGAHFKAEFTAHEIASLADSIQDWQPFPDTVAALQVLSTRYELAILSNIDNDLFAHSARKLEVEIAHVITAQQVASYKPAAFNFEMALMKIGKPKDKVLHVAESLYHDVAPAKKLGLRTVWLNRRTGKEGFGATKPGDAVPDLELPDLKSLAERAV